MKIYIQKIALIITISLLLSACGTLKATQATEVDNNAPRVPISPLYKKG
jgi:uncharacterized protein YceK